nr:MAG TPA: hypothetical protein [Caudoviricetes sp.]
MWQGFICGMQEAAIYGRKVAPSVSHYKLPWRNSRC